MIEVVQITMNRDFWHTADKLKAMQRERTPPRSLALHVESTESPEPMYDYDAAVHFIHVKTTIAIAEVEKFLRAVSLYPLGLGLTPDDEEVFETTAALSSMEHRAAMSPPEAATELHRERNRAMECVARMQDAEEDYLRRVGVIVDVVDLSLRSPRRSAWPS